MSLHDIFDRLTPYLIRVYADRERNHLPIDVTSMTERHVLALHREVDELLDEVPWKTHRTYDDHHIISDNVAEELVDILFYTLSVAFAHGITMNEFMEAAEVKQLVIEDRWRQEKELLVWDKPVVLVDLDGVLNEYPGPYLEFIRGKTGVEWAWENLKRRENREVDQRWKHEYRTSGIKRRLPAIQDNVEAVRSLAAHGHDIVIMSQRPYHKYLRIYGDTLFWLAEHNVPFRKLVFVESKEDRLQFADLKDRISFAVDDDPDVVDKLRDLGIKAYQLGVDIQSMKELL